MSAIAAPESSLVIEFRLKHGLCHQCGARIYEVEDGDRLTPLTVSGVSLAGRCLFCYPDKTPNDNNSLPRRKKSRRSSHSSSSLGDVALAPDMVKSDPEAENNETALPQPAAASLPDQNNHNSVSQSATFSSNYPLEEQVPAPSAESSLTEPISQEIVSIEDSDKNIYHGTVLEGTKHQGRGVFRFTYAKGELKGKETVYEGEFSNGLMEGEGTVRDASDCVYTGSFRRGMAHGYGVCTWAQGWKYQGEWIQDQREGKGRLSQDVEGGEVYEGDWENDQWHGVGELKFNGGGRYIGDFRNHKMNGRGRYEFVDLSVYEGAFKNDVRVGSGKMDYKDGNKYSGDWRNNWREGQGTLYQTDGTKFVGTFRGDEKVEGVLHLPDGIMRRETYVNGALQR